MIQTSPFLSQLQPELRIVHEVFYEAVESKRDMEAICGDIKVGRPTLKCHGYFSRGSYVEMPTIYGKMP
jgi:hypothetical protein